jgi:hypothetical protein
MKQTVFIFFLFFMVACNKEKERQAVIDAAIKDKIETFTTKKWDEIRQKELEAASKIADSILLQNADLWQLSMDNLHARPPKAVKPGAPNITINVDSTPVKPLFIIKK